MEIKEFCGDRRALMPLLLIGDEEQAMIENYLDSCVLFAAYEGEKCIAVCAAEEYGGLTPLGRAVEIKNIAVLPSFRKKGAGRAMIDFVVNKFGGEYAAVIAGTGDSPLTVPFYERCGFTLLHTEKDYFLQKYSRPIYECGVKLRDRLWFIRPLGSVNVEEGER